MWAVVSAAPANEPVHNVSVQGVNRPFNMVCARSSGGGFHSKLWVVVCKLRIIVCELRSCNLKWRRRVGTIQFCSYFNLSIDHMIKVSSGLKFWISGISVHGNYMYCKENMFDVIVTA